MTNRKPRTLSDDDLDAAGIDGATQQHTIQLEDATIGSVQTEQLNNAQAMPGMQKFSNITLKRG